MASLDAVRAEEGRLGASRITSGGYFLQSSVCQNAILQAAGFVPHPRHSKGMNQLWVNRALRAQFTQSKGNLCFSKEIYRHNGNKPLSDEELVRVIDGTYQAE